MNTAVKIEWDALEQEILENNLQDIIKEGLRLIIPPAQIPIWEWAEENIELDDSSAIPGAFRIINSPHLKGIFEAIQDPRVRKITIVGSVQFGKTLFMLIVWAYYVVNEPCPMIMMQPTRADATTFIKTKLDPFIDYNDILHNKVRSKKTKGSDNTTDSTNNLKMYSGGWTEIINAGSKGATRGRSVKKTFGDDISVIETDIKSEGDPAKNLEKRTTAFKYDYQNINISQPALKGNCGITARYEQGSQESYYVKCLECGHRQVLDDDTLVWEKDIDAFGKIIKHYPETARIPCERCGYLFNEKERVKMLQNAMDDNEDEFNCGWKANYPEMVIHRSFHLGQISSTLSTMQRVVEERIEMEKMDNADAEQSYWNTVKGLAYQRTKAKETDPVKLIERNRTDYLKPDGKIPNDVLLITCAIDVQRGSGNKPARLEMEAWGWGIGEQAWMLDKREFAGNITDLKDVWAQFDKYYAEKQFIRHDGIQLNISRGFFDSGYEATTVYQYVQDKFNLGFYAIKGANNYGAPLLPRNASYVHNDMVLLITLGTQIIKHTIYNRLNDIVDRGDKFFNFPTALCNHEYFEGLTAEHMVIKKVGLTEYYYYEKKHKHLSNEPIDLLTYNYGAMRHCLPNFEALKDSIDKIKAEKTEKEKEPEPEPEPAKIIKRPDRGGYSVNGWMD